MPAGKDSLLGAVARYSGMAFTVPAAVVAGYFIGAWLDSRLGTHSLYIVGVALGAAGGLIQVVRQLTRDAAMADADDIFERTAARMLRTMLLVAAIGSVVALRLGWTYGVGFVVGALAAWVNFRWLKSFVACLGPGGKPSGFTLFFALRYALLAAAAYVILKYSKLSLPAMFAGLFVSLAAAIVEVLIQLGYARRNLDR